MGGSANIEESLKNQPTIDIQSFIIVYEIDGRFKEPEMTG